MSDNIIYHVCRADEWQAAKVKGRYQGSSQDQSDGFIHFSAKQHVRESTAKHRAGQNDLILLSVDASTLGEALKWEPSRGGILFPHLYGDLPIPAVFSAEPISLGRDGVHQFPAGFDET